MPDATTNYQFGGWLWRVDQEVMRIAGVSVHDLADQCFRDWFEDGITPEQAARLTLEEEGFPFEQAQGE